MRAGLHTQPDRPIRQFFLRSHWGCLLPTKALRAAELISLLSMCINSRFCNEIQRREKRAEDWCGIRLGLMSYGACLLISDVKQPGLYLLLLSAGSINNIFSDMKRERVSSVKWRGARGRSRQCPFSLPARAGVTCLPGGEKGHGSGFTLKGGGCVPEGREGF